MSRESERLSKFLAMSLRHAPHELGLTLQAGGWVPVDDLLAGSAKVGFSITHDELVECVKTNDKQRFAFDDSGKRIRANQGHSVAVDLQLAARQPPADLFHGTVVRFLAPIFAEGLKKGRRHHVHLSQDAGTAKTVGERRGVPVILRVAAGAMFAAGFTFFRSANGVWLTDGVPHEYLSRLP